jgi:glycosyltransferase involved in cell wall biosynthesis
MRYSVIITAYNGIANSLRCLESLYQFSENSTFECIFINDGSTDETELKLNEFKKNHKSLIVISHVDNKGPIVRRNEGIKEAQGEYIVFLDNDTQCTGDILSTMHKKISSLPNAGIVGMCGIFLPDMHNSYHIHASQVKRDIQVDAVPTYCMMVSRKVIEEGIRFDEVLHFMQHEDVDFCLQASAHNFLIYSLSDIPLTHFEHGSRISYKNRYEKDFTYNWQYLIHKWKEYNSQKTNKSLPHMKAILSKNIPNAKFYDFS